MLRLSALVLCVALMAAPTIVVPSEQQTFASGPERVALLELYTSEGCSSCPPADRWLSGLEGHPDLFEAFVPIAFHVDYWNYIGWKDRFASRAYSDRQRRYIDEGAARAVYTPGFFRAGEEWLGWRKRQPVVDKVSVRTGTLDVRIEGDDVAARFTPTKDSRAKLELHIALLGMNLQTQVRAGENRGRNLEHDFVVLSHLVVPLEAAGASYRGMALVDADGAGAIAVWVATADSQAPLQATGGFL